MRNALHAPHRQIAGNTLARSHTDALTHEQWRECLLLMDFRDAFALAREIIG